MEGRKWEEGGGDEAVHTVRILKTTVEALAFMILTNLLHHRSTACTVAASVQNYICIAMDISM